MGRSWAGGRVGRRRVLGGIGATLLGSTAGRAAAHPRPDRTPGGTSDGPTPAPAVPAGFGPIGHVHVAGAKEAVVDDAGETAYVATSDGFAAVDVRDPGAPRVLAERRDLLADHPDGPMRQVYDAKLDADSLLVVGPANPNDAVAAAVHFDVSDPAAPVRRSVYETAGPLHNCDIQDGVAYLSVRDGARNPLVLVDLQAGEELGRWAIPDTDSGWLNVPEVLRLVHDVWVQAERAYLACWDAGTFVLDVSDPAEPAVLTRVRGRSPNELAVRGDAARKERLERPGNDHYVTASADGTLLGIGAEAWDVDGGTQHGGPGGIELWDLSEPGSPDRLSAIEAPSTSNPRFTGVWTTAHNFEFHDGRLYSSWYRGGVRLYDVREPATPTLTRAWSSVDVASFWTARVGRPGEFFLASSVGSEGALPGTPMEGDGGARTDAPAAVYTFPDPAPGAGPPGGDVRTPGFGILAALAGMGVAGWLAGR